MIRKSLDRTKESTLTVFTPHPDPKARGFPIPKGTGFFVSTEGYLITARHVIKKEESDDLYGESDVSVGIMGGHCGNIKIIKEWPNFDLVLLKVDSESTQPKGIFKKHHFPFLEIDFNIIPEGTPVYSFGYPLPKFEVKGNEKFLVGVHYYCPRTTSAIISSHHEMIGMLISGSKFIPKYYIIDKALNYGNSGGPVVVCESGKVVSVCVRFQPVNIRQGGGTIMIPSNYGITSSLGNIESDLREYLGE